MTQVYDQIGRSYTAHRCADPRIVGAIVNLIGIAATATLADIGAGTGNYSCALAELGYQVNAVEPSGTMRRQ